MKVKFEDIMMGMFGIKIDNLDEFIKEHGFGFKDTKKDGKDE